MHSSAAFSPTPNPALYILEMHLLCCLLLLVYFHHWITLCCDRYLRCFQFFFFLLQTAFGSILVHVSWFIYRKLSLGCKCRSAIFLPYIAQTRQLQIQPNCSQSDNIALHSHLQYINVLIFYILITLEILIVIISNQVNMK